MTRPRTLLLLILVFASGAWSAEVSEREANFRKSLLVRDSATVMYYDEDGSELGFDSFLHKVSSGRSLSKTVSDDRQRVELRINPLNGPKPSRKEHYGIGVGSLLPPFRLPDLDGKPVSNADFVGRYTLVNFFFAECLPCIHEIPELNAFAGTHPDFGFFAITFDAGEAVREFTARHRFAWRGIADAQRLIDTLGVKVYPSFLLVNPKGAVLGIASSATIATPEPQVNSQKLSLWIEGLMRTDQGG